MPDEFLFIICNAEDRLNEVRKLPSGKINLKKHKISKTYPLEQGLTYTRAPDRWLEKVKDSKTDYKKVKWEFESEKPREETPTKTEFKINQGLLSDIDKFRIAL